MPSRIFYSICILLLFLSKFQLHVSASDTPSIDSRELESRIIGGKIAESNRYPFFAWLHIQISSFDGSASWCGGSLIAPDVVMTSAQCIFSAVNVDVWLNSTSFEYSEFEHFRKSIRQISHPKYIPQNGMTNDDIGLVFLDSPVNDVPLVRFNKKESLPGPNQTKVTVIGFGLTVFYPLNPGSFYSDHLMEASLPTISNGECIKRAGAPLKIQESDLCCYNKKKGVCYGDAGGPLILSSNTSQNNVQVGIVSHINGMCAKDGVPQVFTRVSYYHAWIQENICKFSKVKPSSCKTVKPSSRKPTTKPIVKRSSIKPVS